MPSEQEKLGNQIISMHLHKPDLTASQCHDLITERNQIILDRSALGMPTVLLPNANGASH